MDPETQRREALQTANRIRTARAAVKRKVAEGRYNPLEILQEPTELLEGMPVADLLRAIPQIGPAKVNRALTKARINPTKPIGSLTEHQVWTLDEILSRPGRKNTQNPWCRAISV